MARGRKDGNMITRTTRRLPLVRAVVVAVGVCCLALVTGSGARAAAPSQFRFTSTDSFTDTTSCSFPIETNLTTTHVGRVYFDDAGNFLRLMDHAETIGTDTANGITLPESDHTVDIYDSAGADMEVGTPIHIQGVDGGLAIRDAGLLFFNPDGSVGYMHGQHPYLVGDTASLCAAFS
jgi:hypothetical protein